MSIEKGVLYIVATPIGNLADLTPRAREVLAGVDRIAAEDTRHSRGLLNHFGISAPLSSLHEHNERQQVPRLLEAIAAGESLALISDAGTPLLSDPGYHLVRGARQAGLRVVPIPGVSALIAALSVAGLPTDRFVFEGFLPAKSVARRKRLEALKDEPRTLVFYESSHRIEACLIDMAETLGEGREAVVARELTKTFETVHGDSLGGLCAWLRADENQRKGEFVVMVHGSEEANGDEAEAEALRMVAILAEELPLKRAAKLVARITGVKKNRLYDLTVHAESGGA